MLAGGYLATLFWYRRHAHRVGVATATRGFLVAGLVGVVITILAFVEWRVGWFGPIAAQLVRNDFLLAVLVIAGGLLVLARLERSVGLAVIAVLSAATAWISHVLAPWAPDILIRAWTSGLYPEALSSLILLTGGVLAAVRQRRQVAAR